MQEWGTWGEHEGNFSARFCGLYNARAAPQQMLVEVAAHSVTQQALVHTQNPIHVIPYPNYRVVLRASCGYRNCFRVVTVAHLRRALLENKDCLRCPAHQQDSRTYSIWVRRFMDMVLALGVNSVMIHDWKDVPTRSDMHWDLVMFLNGRAFRFEIDGPVHEPRHFNDGPKDAVVNLWGAQPFSVARFHYTDYHNGQGWQEAFIQYTALTPAPRLHGMFYTSRYQHLMDYDPANDMPYIGNGGNGIAGWRIL